MTLNNKDKILTTGWAGYIGSHTCKLMSKKGISPIVFGNLSSGKKNLLNGVSLY
jgi:UDP-glucose 4-epimerase